MSSKTILSMSVVVMTICALVALPPLATAAPKASPQTALPQPVEQKAGVVERRVGPEDAIGGLTREEVAAQQLALRTRLVAEMPQRALDAPVRVEITQTDRDELAQPPVSGTPLRIGVAKQISPAIGVVNGQLDRRGVMQDTEAGGFVWAVTVTSPGAQAIRVHFTNFSLPADAEVYFFSLEDQAYGPHLGVGRNGNGDFWTRTISSDTGIIQLHYSGESAEAALREISFEVSELGHVAGRVPSSPERGHDNWPCANNVWCLVDAVCMSGTPADPAKGAIAMMQWVSGGFIYGCTGGLLADTVSETQIPYFLTANHCVSTSISNLQTWFKHTTDSCNGVCPHSSTPGPDTIGFTVVVSNPATDATLGTLNQAPPSGATYLGWNTTPIAFTGGAPLYRISNANSGPQVYQELSVSTAPGTCSGLPQGNFIYSTRINGSQMGGSSGAPVVNSASEVVGQLYGCCGSNCANQCDFVSNRTVDGAFAASWCSLAEFLDPSLTGCCSDSQCDDGSLCNGAETCHLSSGVCQPGTPLPCNERKSEQLPSLDHWNGDAVSRGGPPAWYEDFESYALGSSLHLVGGWRGWDGSANWTAYVTDVQSHSPVQSVDIVGSSDLVRVYSGYTTGEWTYAAWMYVPDDFQSGGTDGRGSFFILLNTYNNGGPYSWSVQLGADSDTNTFIRDGSTPASVPLITGRWVKLQVAIDLNNDLYQVYYDGVELGVAESWTAGIFGEGGGVLDIGAVDLYANSSSSVYWDDMSLEPGFPKGACCYYSQGYPVCVQTSEIDCCCLDGIFQGFDTPCPTENVTTASHVSGPFTHLTDPAQQCPEGFSRGGGCVPGDPIDPWRTAQEVDNCHQFGIPESPPIPADFFGPGSDPFGGFVCLEGEPLGQTDWGYYDTADTLVRRSADPFDRCEIPSGSEVVVDVEIVALSLRSVAPVTVTYNGGQNPESWDVTVDLSDVTPPPGTITAVKTHCNGGTYSSVLPVQPKFTFTKVADPGAVYVLDTGLEGIPYIELVQDDDPPWTSDVSENLGLETLVCTDFHPGIEDPAPVTDCDCNGNAVRDKCDIEGGGSPDVDGDGVPDECSLQPVELPPYPEHQALKNRYISINPKTNLIADTVIKVEVAEMRRCAGAPTRSCLVNADCDAVCDDIASAVPGYYPYQLLCPPMGSNDCSLTNPPSLCLNDPLVPNSGPCVDLAPDPPLAWVVQQPVQDPSGGCKRPNCPPYPPGQDNCCEDDDWMSYLGATVPTLDGFASWTEVWAALPEDVLHIAGCAVVPATTYGVYACSPGNLDLCAAPLLVGTVNFPRNDRPTARHLYADVCGGVLAGTVLPPDGVVNVTDLQQQQNTLINYGSLNAPQMHVTWADLHGPGIGIPPQYNLNASDLQILLNNGLKWSQPWVNSFQGIDPQDCPPGIGP